MSKLKAFTSLFIQTEETEPNATATPAAAVPPTTPVPAAAPSLPKASTSDVNKFIEILTKDIEDSNLEGYDYLEFRDSINELKTHGFNEEQAIKSASISVKSLTSPKKIIESIKHYIGVVDENKKEFEKNVSQKMKDSLTKQKAELTDVDKQIDALIKKKGDLVSSIQATEEKIEKNSISFSEAYNLVKNKLKADMELISKVLGEKA